jgi:hypothetical protein
LRSRGKPEVNTHTLFTAFKLAQKEEADRYTGQLRMFARGLDFVPVGEPSAYL